MNRYLVVGVDTVAGANVAASFSERHHVCCWTSEPGYEVAGCDVLDHRLSPADAIAAAEPEILVYCGAAARSCWEPDAKSEIHDSTVVAAQCWASAARAAGVRFVMVSSDAVFTGPWLFHDEQSHGQCSSYHAQIIRATEDLVGEICEDALILRTNVYGWSAAGSGAGWVETLLRSVETKRIVEQDHIRHAAPMLATDFADILERACNEQLTGTYHVAGAERVNPLQFTQRLADRFELPWLAMRRESILTSLPQGFGEGECSLQTKQIRKQLCVAMPLLSEGLDRLKEQAENGYRERLQPVRRTVAKSRAA